MEKVTHVEFSSALIVRGASKQSLSTKNMPGLKMEKGPGFIRIWMDETNVIDVPFSRCNHWRIEVTETAQGKIKGQSADKQPTLNG